ncbi:MAG TPA: CHAP domain-containing protein [Candidatus Saccharimonadales bacterium]|nr:CHAP domain-containing protein [Candidatus Saccharimonadales bacterium]
MNTKSVFMALAVIATLTFVNGQAAGATDGTANRESVKKSETSTKKSDKEAKKVTYKIKSGDTLDAIAKDHKTTYVRLYNANKSIKNPNVINAGQTITIPSDDAKLPQRYAKFTSASAAAAPVVTQPVSVAAPTNQVVTYQSAAPATTSYTGSTAGNTYAWGNCTWYVKNKRPDMPNQLGNGGQWAGNAAARGYATGSTPRVGAVAEQAGHVAYVEAVNGNNVTISEMNYAGGIGQVHTRTVPASTFHYIY